MPLIQKLAPKPTQKHGMILVGISLTDTLDDCAFQHKVALFARGFQINAGKLVTYKSQSNNEGTRDTLSEMIKQSIEKVANEGGFKPTDMNKEPMSAKNIEIEDIMKATAAASKISSTLVEVPTKLE